MDRSISILGSTGSIGTQTIEVARDLGLKINALTGNKNIRLLEKQAREFNPQIVAAADESAARDLKILLGDTNIKVLSGIAGLEEAATILQSDTVVTAVVGTVGLKPTLAAIQMGKRIALANKETLVCAGSIVMDSAKKYGAEIIPVDSEHSAIFQCLACKNSDSEVKKIILTCSGGPFREKDKDFLKTASRKDALKHPNWSMGAKITIDSATLMNKGLEYIEAMHLFGAAPEQIEILVHPQSIIHSMVEFCDNSIIAQLGLPDMRLPIQLALTYPQRVPGLAEELDFTQVGGLTFERPRLDVFGCLELAMKTAKIGGNKCAAMNAANEVAVGMFLEDKIGFNDIYERVNFVVDKIEFINNPTLDDIIETDRRARELAENLV